MSDERDETLERARKMIYEAMHARIDRIVANADTMHNLMQRPLDIKWLAEECPIDVLEAWRQARK